MMMTGSSWQVMHVVANHEKKVAAHLSVRAVEHYLPLYAELSQWTDRRVMVERPLFAGYVFVRFPATSRRVVISVPGAIRLLGEQDGETVSDGEIERIRAGLAGGARLRPHAGLGVGTRVRVRRGAFAGSEGMVTHLRPSCKVVIALAAVRQSFSLEIDWGEVEVIGGMESRACA